MVISEFKEINYGKTRFKSIRTFVGRNLGFRYAYLRADKYGLPLGRRHRRNNVTLYIGYKPTVLGSVLGGIWGFFDAGIGGVVVAWLYNMLAK